MVMTGAWFMAWPPHFLNPFRWVKVKKSKSQTVPLPVTRPQLDSLVILSSENVGQEFSKKMNVRGVSAHVECSVPGLPVLEVLW